MRRAALSAGEARRIAIAAQGLNRSRPARPDLRHVRRVMADTRLIQIDFVNVLVPAHYVVPFSRLGPYDRSRLDELAYDRHEWTEQWAHEASLVPMDTWPLLQFRMRRHTPRPTGFADFLRARRGYVNAVLRQIRDEGPAAPEDLPPPRGVDSRIPGAWIGTVQRAVLEALFGQGRIAAVGRRENFTRVYDLAERVIPGEHFERRLHEHDQRRELLTRAAAGSGIAREKDLADYYRMPMRHARPRIAELVEEGVLQPVTVEGRGDMLLHRAAKLPRQVEARALLAPFDPLVWHRPRLRQLFDFDYKLEIFVPAEKREWGYYVMPFLLGDRLAARVDLKADRRASRLEVLAAWREAGTRETEVADALAGELLLFARWLGLERIRVGRRGGLARKLRKAVAAKAL